jgi:Fic family protein
MAYAQIENYPSNSLELASSELLALSTVWSEKRDELQETGVFQEFLKKMQREWAIETGIIEQLYTWDRGVTEVLIEQGIDASLIAHQGGVNRDEADHIKNIIDDQLAIVEGLFSFIKGEQPLTEHFIRGLQAQFTNHQDTTEAVTPDGKLIQVTLEKGKYKKHPNNPRRPDGQEHWYCPPELTQSEMQNLVSWYKESENTYPPEVRAAWLHHRFTQVHPFQDGNGRVARALASLVFLKSGLFPLVIRDSDRKEYICALEEADSGDIRKLVNLFVKRQKEAILHALGLEQQVQQSKYADQIISSALEVLKGKYAKETSKLSRVYDYAENIFDLADARLEEISDTLNGELRQVTPPNQIHYTSHVTAARNTSSRRHYFYNQIIEVANKLNYFANLDQYRAWIRLAIHTEENFEFIISIHAYGHSDSGIMVASALTTRRVEKEEGGTEPVNVQPATTDVFQFNYAESMDSTKQRFNEWLESSLAIALAEWKRQISA